MLPFVKHLTAYINQSPLMKYRVNSITFLFISIQPQPQQLHQKKENEKSRMRKVFPTAKSDKQTNQCA